MGKSKQIKPSPAKEENTLSQEPSGFYAKITTTRYKPLPQFRGKCPGC